MQAFTAFKLLLKLTFVQRWKKSHSIPYYQSWAPKLHLLALLSYSKHFDEPFPLLRWNAHKKLTGFKACLVLLFFIPRVMHWFFKQSKQRGFSRIQFLLFYCSINFIYVQICCFYQFDMRERDASGGRNTIVLQNEALGRRGAGDA